MTAYPTTAGLTLAGRYSVGELIGRGGMGEVRSGWDKVLDRPVAIKLLRADTASNPTVRRRFDREARAAARLVHPNIVQVYDSGEDRDVPFIVMEKLPGRSLRDDIRSRRLSVPEVTSVALQVLAALEVAHRAGLVHRDIKPANILSAETEHWKVADFGIAKSVQTTGGDETATGMILGTPAYLPPERLLGGDATAAGDIYAVGVILYEAIAGSKPFEATDQAGWLAAAASPPPPLRRFRPAVPAALAAAVERSLSRDPTQRFRTAEEMAGAIREGGDDVAREGTGWLAVPPATPTELEHTDILPRRRARRPTPLWMGGIAAGIAALVALTVGLSTGGGADKARPPVTTVPALGAPTTIAPTTVPIVAPRPPDPGHPAGKDQGGGKGDHGG